ncbi:hypothetical protein XELAEV_18032430mg [Xenopus laevis]|uniref:Uncharacterized protein n=1 Tax=Xenopus laevis TaxID=8355 RepID=A0A974CRV6_XENLA|nr:hypothetical protein XELAEV_18032430mg [Xenopus laevis]
MRAPQASSRQELNYWFLMVFKAFEEYPIIKQHYKMVTLMMEISRIPSNMRSIIHKLVRSPQISTFM